MMRQSPKPYAKGKVRQTPPRPRCGKLFRGMRNLSTAARLAYWKIGREVGHLWGSAPMNYPFVLPAG
jgi:hypothetical protein